MSYVLQIWEQPKTYPLPTSVEQALSTLDCIRASTVTQNAAYLSLAQRLTARFPCITSLDAKAMPENEWAWGDGPLDGVTTDGVYVVSLNSLSVRKVKPFVLTEAASCGMLVLDEQAGELHFPDGRTVTSRTVYQRLLDAEEAHRKGDYTYAFSEYMDLAQAGIAGAQYTLAVMFESGQGVPADMERAMEWYTESAGQGEKMAQYRLGFLYLNGRKVELDYKESMHWFRLAASQQHEAAERRMGDFYLFGRGVEQDFVQAASWHESAARHGDVPAQCSLGIAYLQGRGLTQNFSEAKKWLRSAAAQGDDLAFFNLGKMYLHGQGVPASPVIAHALFNFCAHRESHFAAQAQTLSPPERLEPQALKAAKSLIASMERAKDPLAALEKKVGRIDVE